MTLVGNTIGEHLIQCSAKQDYYDEMTHTLTVNVVDTDDGGNNNNNQGGGGTKGLHKFTIVFIVLGCVFLLIIIIVVIVACCTKTICFGDRSKDSKRSRNENRVRVVDTNYVVGQDYVPNQ